MRPRRFRRWRQIAAGMLVLIAGAGRVEGQGVATEGGIFLLLPVGARAVGMGQAVVAERGGSEMVWWNPAGVSWSTRREVAIHHFQTLPGTGDAVTIVLPSNDLGTVAISAFILDLGDQPQIPQGGGPETGTLFPRNLVFAATYATTLGRQFAAGVTYKVVQLRLDCSGLCNTEAFSASTSALDLGAQYDLGSRLPLTLGVAVRNIGVRLQVNDESQSDPLPTRIEVGAVYRWKPPARYGTDLEIRGAADLLDELKLRGPLARLGADVVWQERAHLRGGYVFESGRSEAGGATLGLGYETRNLVIDIARAFSGLGADAGQAPIYLSLRFLF